MRGYLITNAFMRGGSFEKMRKLFMEAAQKQDKNKYMGLC